MRKLLFLFLWIVPIYAFSAGQFLGGELSYQVLHSDASNTRYLITLKFYRNCASFADLPSPVVKFINTVDITRNTHPIRYQEEVFNNKTLTYLPKTALSPCVINTPPDCYEFLVYTKEVNLPYSPEGYTIFYSFCCRDEGFTNIRKESWNMGSEMENQVIIPGQALTFLARIPRQDNVAINSSPVITTDSIISGCLQREIDYQFKFTDPDGDSLVYAIGRPYSKADGTTTYIQPLFYNNGYSSAEPMAGNPRITFDPATARLKGIPDKKGFFILLIEVSEFRNGNLINVHNKEVQINVYDCGIQKPPSITNCNNRTVSLLHSNNDQNKYFWDFGVDGTSSDTSAAFLPVFTYPSAGEYLVKLRVTNADGCTDSTTTSVKIFPKVNADFTWTDPICNGDPIILTDASTTGMGSISKWTWKNFNRSKVFGSGSELNLPYSLPSTSIQSVSVWLVVETPNGCKDSLIKAINVYPRAKANAGPDTTIAFDRPYRMKGSGGNQYLWTPATGLSNANVSDPVLTINRDQAYVLEVSNDGFCSSKDTVFIRYMKGPDIFVPDAFTPNNDGLNDVFKVSGVSVRIKAFEIYNRFGNIIFSTTNLEKGWDGTINRIPQESGVYVWCVRGEDQDGKPIVRKGTLLLLR